MIKQIENEDLNNLFLIEAFRWSLVKQIYVKNTEFYIFERGWH